MSKTNWLDRRTGPSGPYICLCLSQKEFDTALDHCGITTEYPWLSKGFPGKMHQLKDKKGELLCIVCIDTKAIDDPISIACLIVHEAVHIWQHYIDSLNEHNPGIEQEAYAIQYFSEVLIREYRRRIYGV